MANIYFQCCVLCHIYLFSILVDRAGAGAVAQLANETPLRLLIEKNVGLILKVVEIKISTTMSCVMGPVKLNEMLQYMFFIRKEDLSI